MKLKLHWQILIAMCLGTVVGFAFQSLSVGEPSGPLFATLSSLGTIFIRLLRMIIVPLIFASIVSGVSNIGEGKKLGRIGLKTMIYYVVTSMLAILVGLALSNLFTPGIGVDIPVNRGFNPGDLKTPGSLMDILIRMIPTNPVHAASSGDMLGVIFFSIILGIGISKLKPEHEKMIKSFFNSFFELMMKITEIIIKFAPIGVFGLMTKVVATTGFDMIKAVGKYMLTIAAGLSIHLLITLPVIFFLATRMNPIKHFKAMASALATAFSTSSSSATLPLTIRNIRKNVGVSNRISSFVLPLGATVNMDGTALYECAGVIFISQVMGLELTIIQQFIVVITALLASIGAAGIPSAGLVVIFIVTQAIGFKDADVAIIIGTMLAVDRPLDMFRTMINVFSDSIGAVVIAKSEGEKDFYRGELFLKNSRDK